MTWSNMWSSAIVQSIAKSDRLPDQNGDHAQVHGVSNITVRAVHHEFSGWVDDSKGAQAAPSELKDAIQQERRTKGDGNRRESEPRWAAWMRGANAAQKIRRAE